MVGFDIFERSSDNPEQFLSNLTVCLLDLLLCYEDRRSVQPHTVELLRIVEQSLILSLPDCIKDLPDTLFVFSVAVRAALQQILQQVLFRTVVQFLYPHFPIPP